MAMTREERATQLDLANRLGEQGYATYAKLFMLFDLRLTSDPRYIGFMEPNKGRITLNRTLEAHQMLLTIRHEILHEYLTHELRLLEHLAEKNPELDGDEVSLKEILYKDDIFNIAADYEISNRGYTEQDKKDMKNIKFNGQIVSGLVTEDKHPDWIDLTVEEMYDLLRDERDQAKQDAQQDQNNGDASNDNNSQSQDSGSGASGESQDSDGNESSNDTGQNSNDESSDSGDNESNSDDEDNGSNDDNQGNQGSDSGRESNQDNNGSGSQDGQDSQSNETSNSQSNSNGKSSNSNIQVVRGTFKDGKFYDLNGKEIIPGA